MLLNLIKTKEITEIGRQLLSSNKNVVESILSTGQSIAKQGIEYNRSVLQSGINAVSSSREQASRIVDQVLDQTHKIEERVIEVLHESSDKAAERVTQIYDRVGNPADILGNAFDETVLTSVNKIAEPTVDLIKNTVEQVTEVPNKLLKTAAKSEK